MPQCLQNKIFHLNFFFQIYPLQLSYLSLYTTRWANHGSLIASTIPRILVSLSLLIMVLPWHAIIAIVHLALNLQAPVQQPLPLWSFPWPLHPLAILPSLSSVFICCYSASCIFHFIILFFIDSINIFSLYIWSHLREIIMPFCIPLSLLHKPRYCFLYML